ncbi:MAG: UDP-N-acetylmuramate dehydrogenase, partial [Rhodospirillales bacterium]|nr:UDP-N-acetylmuramate dehydrogenase [Rhodospirillales bacterium]
MVGTATSPLIDRLPPVMGQYTPNFDMGKITWFRVGGPAEVLFRPANDDDLAQFLAGRPIGLPITIIGMASNLLVRDGGIPGVVIRLGKEFADIHAKGTEITAGSAAAGLNVARFAETQGLQGLEFLSGIPGTVGGALRMNSGAYGVEVKDVFVSAEALDANGVKKQLSAEDMGFSYRQTAVPADWVFTSARLRASHGRREDITRRMTQIQSQREVSQPTRIATGGSTFKNPPGAKAWELIQQAGCRGLRRGGAMVSEMHCNFLVNAGNATATDLEEL